jgi:predicted SAM-dependent methyltransferase
MAVSALSVRRLIVGCGDHYFEDWYCVDKYDLPHHKHSPDLIADVLEGLPFPDGSYDQIHLGHLLEHLPFDRAHEAVAECWRLLASGGRLAVVGPCIELAIRTGQPDWLLEIIRAHPTPDMPGLGHEWTPTTALTLEVVRKGIDVAPELVDVAEVMPPTWPNPSDAPWQCAILATKP